MAYTLISSIGTGMYKDEGGYRKTTYCFKDGKTYKTALFLKAILETECYAVEKVILVGTRTSSWDVLIPDDSDADPDLWLRIKDECKTGLSDEAASILEKKLPEWYHLPFALKIHSPVLESGNAETIFALYGTIVEELAPDTDILFDITHGFRSMPILIYQALQLGAIQPHSIHLIYGEYIDKEKTSSVRDLSKYWDFYEIAAAKRAFEGKFDGKSLAKKISPYWESGAKCLVRFSEIVECNYSLQIPDLLRQIKNAVDGCEAGNNPPWVIDVRNNLGDMYKKLHKTTVSETLRLYSKMLEEKGLITQAVIALQIALETAVVGKYGGDNYIGDWDWWQDYGKDFFLKIRNRDKKMAFSLQDIENLRNQIAHGGGRDKKTGEYPHLGNLASVLKKGNAAADRFFTLLEEA